MRLVVRAGLLLLVAGAALAVEGCAHRCGYGDVRMTTTLVSSSPERRSEPRWMLVVLHHPSREDTTLRVAVSREWVVERRVMHEFSGVQVRVPYHWSASALKPLLPATLVLAFWMPLREPHRHDASVWGMGDYWRDFAAWFNPGEAFPSGRQELHGPRVVFRRESAWQPVQRLLSPVQGTAVALRWRDETIGSEMTDGQGEATFDLRRLARRLPVREEVVLALHCEKAARRVVVEGSVLMTLRQPAGPAESAPSAR